MKTLNANEIQNVSGGLSPALKNCVLMLPIVGAIEGGIAAYKIGAEAGSSTPVENVLLGMGLGFTAGLFFAVALEGGPRKVEEKPGYRPAY